MEVLRPRDEAELAALIRDAESGGRPLAVEGGGTRGHVGRPVEAEALLDLSAFNGIIDYDPMELVLTAGAATPLADIEALLAGNEQMLAFEPPRAAGAGVPTLGGALAANASGPRRFVAGAARDHLLGFRAVSGRGEAFKAGGRVVKNVTGFDLAKLMAGSWGTLAVMTEISVKVLPQPRTTRTLLLSGLDARQALAAMAKAAGSSAAVSGAAFLPAAMAARSTVAVVAAAGTGLTALRLEGFEASVAARVTRLESMFEDAIHVWLDDAESAALWREIRDVDLLVGPAEIVWRLTGTGNRHGLPELDDALLDWAGALVWRAAEAPPPGAILWRGPQELRRRRGGAPERSAAYERIIESLKRAFDPADILNRGRLHPPLDVAR